MEEVFALNNMYLSLDSSSQGLRHVRSLPTNSWKSHPDPSQQLQFSMPPHEGRQQVYNNVQLGNGSADTCTALTQVLGLYSRVVERGEIPITPLHTALLHQETNVKGTYAARAERPQQHHRD